MKRPQAFELRMAWRKGTKRKKNNTLWARSQISFSFFYFIGRQPATEKAKLSRLAWLDVEGRKQKRWNDSCELAHKLVSLSYIL